MLKCQELGLNTCWVAMTHGKSKAEINRGQKLLIIISLGYGETQGVPHKGKRIAELGKADQSTEWFDRGMEAVSLFFSGEQVDTMQFWRSVVKCDCLSC